MPEEAAHPGSGGAGRQDGIAVAFPQETEGAGAEELAPAVLADGTKQFELTASVFDWEVEAGKVVEAWGYNGQVRDRPCGSGSGRRSASCSRTSSPSRRRSTPTG